jgi:hypothetical protein
MPYPSLPKAPHKAFIGRIKYGNGLGEEQYTLSDLRESFEEVKAVLYL